MSIKISNFVPLNTPAGNDILPIIDVSEPNTVDQNKKITVSNLLSLAGAGGNPYLQTDLTGTFSSNVNTSGIILGENNNIISNEAENSLIFGNNNSLEVSGDFQQGDNNYILGSFNTNKDNSKQTFIVGYLNILGGDSDYSILIGSESFLGFRTDGYTDTSFDSKQSFVAGYKNTSLGFSNTCVGNNNILYEGTQTSVVIGSNIIVNSDVGIGNSPNIIEGVIAIGDEATATDDYSVALGFNTEAGGRYSTCLGPYSTVEAGANDAISIGGSYISSTAEESISIGLFSYTNGPASIAIGPRSSANPTTARAISIGDGSAARAANSIVIGGNNGVNNTCTNSISIGDESGIFSGGIDAIVLGSNNNINNNCQGSISIGKGNTIFTDSPNCIALGYNANVATALTNSIQLGTGTVTTSNTLQFGSTKLASNLGIAIKTNTAAPAVTATDVGTLGLNAGTPQYVDSSGTWTSFGSSSNYTPPTTTEGDIFVRGVTNDTRLPIGATNQVLTVDTAIAGRLKWATPVQPLTTKGDLLIRDSTNLVRLPVGSDGQILITDSSTSTGVKWGAVPAGTVPTDYIQVVPTNASFGNSETNMLINASTTTVGTPGVSFSSGTGLFTFGSAAGVWEFKGVVSYSSTVANNRFYIRPVFPTGAPSITTLFTSPICAGTTNVVTLEHHAIVSGRLVLPTATTAFTMRLMLFAASASLSITGENNASNWGKIALWKVG